MSISILYYYQHKCGFMHTLRHACAIGFMVTIWKMSNFIADHIGPFSIHVMQHSTNIDACTPSQRYYRHGGDQQDTFRHQSQILPSANMIHIIIHIHLYVHSNIGAIVLLVSTQRFQILLMHGHHELPSVHIKLIPG